MKHLLLVLALLLPLPAMAAPAPITVPTIAALQAGNFSSYATVQVLGYNTAGDGGGGFFNWSSASVVTEDSCTIFKTGALATGRFLRQLNGANISVEMCGAYNNGTNSTATRTAFQKAFDYIAGTARPSGIIEAMGPTYIFDTTTVTKAASEFCPKLRGAGINATLISFAPGSPSPAFDFIGVPGAFCDGGVTGIIFTGNSNTYGVKLSGATGATLDIAITNLPRAAVWLCNCSSGAFTEVNHIKVHSNNLDIGQQVAVFSVSGGNDSFAGNAIDMTISLTSGIRTTPLISIGSGAFWYNGGLTANIHNLNAATGAFLIRNDSGVNAAMTAGTLQLEGSNTAALGIADPAGGPVYYGGTVYSLGQNRCVGVKYGADVILAKIFNIGPSAVPDLSGADQYCLTQTFNGASGVQLNTQSINENGTTFRVNVFNPLNSYNASIVFTMATDKSGPGNCAVAASVVSLTIDTNGWGAPTLGCSTSQPTLNNASWTAAGWIVNYDVHGQ